MSPTAIFSPGYVPVRPAHDGGVPGVGREGVPGVGDEGGYGRGYTGYPPDTLPGPYLVVYWPQGPTYGQMKLILSIL